MRVTHLHSGAVNLVLTSQEFHDLRVIAHIPEEDMRNALRASTAARIPGGAQLQTHAVYAL